MLQFSVFPFKPPFLGSREVELSVDVDRPAQYVMFKFLGPTKEDAERVGVHCIKLYGHRTSTEEMHKRTFRSKLVYWMLLSHSWQVLWSSPTQDVMAPLPASTSTLVDGALVLTRVLSFLAEVLRDLAGLQARRKAASLDPTVFGVRLTWVLCTGVCGCDVVPVSHLRSRILQSKTFPLKNSGTCISPSP